MAEAYLAEIRIFGCSFAPLNWAFCQGQILPISQNTSLFSLLGTNYGGNGTTNFALPNLIGNVPVGLGQAATGTQYDLGETAGFTTVTLTSNELPSHSHSFGGLSFRTDAETNIPAANQCFAKATGATPYMPSTGTPQLAAMDPTVLAPALGGSSGTNPHNNMMPFLVMNYCICTQGIFPPRG